MGKKYEEYRSRIFALDKMVDSTTDPEEKKRLIDQDIALNEEYIRFLKKPLTAKIILCIVLSILYLIGLMVFLPQIIIRKNRIRACERRITYLRELKANL